METITIKIEKPGTLSKYEDALRLDNAESIKVIGRLNRKDLFFLRKLAGGCIDSNNEEWSSD
jgi:hypothetical protein